MIIIFVFQDLFNDDYVDEIETEFKSIRWWEAEIFRIHGCKTLRLRLDDGRNSIADYFTDKLLILEDIEKLELQTFLVGKVPTKSTYGTVSITRICQVW